MTNGKTLNIKEAKANFIDITNNDTLRAFLKKVEKYKPLTASDEARLFTAYENANENDKIEIRNEIIERCQMLIYSIAKKYANDNNILDLISEGNLGLVNAFRDFDIKSGNRFSTYATFHIRKSILKYVTEGDFLVKRKNNERVFYLVDKVREQFIEKNGYQPTYEEIREVFNDEYGVKISKNEDVYELYFNSISGFWDDEDKKAFENSSEFVKYTYTENDCINTFDEEYNAEVLNALFQCLTDNEKYVIKQLYGIDENDDASVKSISDEMGVTPERVRQIRKKALAKMKAFAAESTIRI